jgi:hypothetical protein
MSEIMALRADINAEYSVVLSYGNVGRRMARRCGMGKLTMRSCTSGPGNWVSANLTGPGNKIACLRATDGVWQSASLKSSPSQPPSFIEERAVPPWGSLRLPRIKRRMNSCALVLAISQALQKFFQQLAFRKYFEPSLMIKFCVLQLSFFRSSAPHFFGAMSSGVVMFLCVV